MRYIDLSHTFVDNMPVFPGDPAMSLKQITSVEKEGYTDHQLTTVMHVGTHIDAPLHMIQDGKYISDMALDHFVGPGICVDATKQSVIDVDILAKKQLPKGGILFVRTGMATKYGTDAYNAGYPHITEAFANAVVSAGIKIIGIDMINPDVEDTFPIHKILLSHDVLIIENLTNLEALTGISEFEVFAFPLKLRAEASLVRVVARIP